MSDFSSEARAYCRQHGVYFYPNDAGCEQCERDMENIDEEPSEYCVCDISEADVMEGIKPVCDNYIEATTDDKEKIAYCDNCGHSEDCHGWCR